MIATLVFAESDEEKARRAAEETRPGAAADQNVLQRRIIVAISGRSGRWLWSHAVDRAFATYSYPSWERPAALVQGRNSALIAYVDGERWIGLDPVTGRPKAGPFDLGFIPVRPVQHVDLDGDGDSEILALGPGPLSRQQTVAAFSTTTGRPTWVETIRCPYNQSDEFALPLDWPLVVDLDGDGRLEIVVPDSGRLAPRGGYRGLRLFDSATGHARWARPMRPETKSEDGLVHVIDAPDLDGDGTRELVAVSQFDGRPRASSSRARPPEPARVYVDALSGKDGRPLWWWHVDLPGGRYTRIWVPRWWGRGPDGWPLLAVGLGGRLFGGPEGDVSRSRLHPPIVHVLEMSTGREVHMITGLTQPRSADLDGDGLSDLWGEVDGELAWIPIEGKPPIISAP